MASIFNGIIDSKILEISPLNIKYMIQMSIQIDMYTDTYICVHKVKTAHLLYIHIYKIDREKIL